MRASRLLQILLILQNRGRQTSTQLAEELEVVPRTILRDVDAMTEAGLPIIVHQGRAGGIELGFNYRTRLTGLDADEAEALGILLAAPSDVIEGLGISKAAHRARRKLIESFPDTVRGHVTDAQKRFLAEVQRHPEPDARIAALAEAIRGRRIVRLRARSRAPHKIHPMALTAGLQGWTVTDARDPEHPIPMREWGDLNISAMQYPPLDPGGPAPHETPHAE